ncbi:hypothetical protein D9M70_498120 [compost metagenome]
MIDEQHAVQVIDLMLQAGGEQAIGLDHLFLAVTVEMLDGDRRGALDLGVKVWDRQAAFLVDRALIGRSNDLGIDENERGLVVAFFRNIEHQHAFGNADLDRGKADAGRVIHGFEHIVGQTADVRVDGFDRRGNLAEHRIGKDDKRLDRHAAPIADLSISVQENCLATLSRPSRIGPR